VATYISYQFAVIVVCQVLWVAIALCRRVPIAAHCICLVIALACTVAVLVVYSGPASAEMSSYLTRG
jgi:hypothetical protein